MTPFQVSSELAAPSEGWIFRPVSECCGPARACNGMADACGRVL